MKQLIKVFLFCVLLIDSAGLTFAQEAQSSGTFVKVTGQVVNYIVTDSTGKVVTVKAYLKQDLLDLQTQVTANYNAENTEINSGLAMFDATPATTSAPATPTPQPVPTQTPALADVAHGPRITNSSGVVFTNNDKK